MKMAGQTCFSTSYNTNKTTYFQKKIYGFSNINYRFMISSYNHLIIFTFNYAWRVGDLDLKYRIFKFNNYVYG